MASNTNYQVIQDKDRLQVLHDLDLLDTPAVASLDRLTRLVSRLTKSPISLITIVDINRQFFKSSVGLPEPIKSNRETSLSYSICQHVAATNKPFIVEDTRTLPLLDDNLAVLEFNIISYVGMPLTTQNGTCLGSFCVMDNEPRQWTEDEIELVRELSISVMTEIELHAQIKARKISDSRLQSIVSHAPLIFFALDKDGRFTFAEGKGLGPLRWLPKMTMGISAYDLYRKQPEILAALRNAYAGHKSRHITPVGNQYYDTIYEPIKNDAGEVTGVAGVAHNVTEAHMAEQSLKQSVSELAMLNDIAFTLSDYTDLSKTLNNLARKINRLFDGTATTITRFDSELKTRQIIAIYGSPDTTDTQILNQYRPLTMGPNSLYEQLQRKRCILLKNDDNLTLKPALTECVPPDLIDTFFLIPLLSQSEVVGAITIAIDKSHQEISPEDTSLAQTIAGQIATSIHNSHLFSAIQVELVERRRAETLAKRRLKYADMLARCARVLLSEGAEATHLPQALEYLLEGAGVERFFFGKIINSSDGSSSIRWDYECTVPSATPVPATIRQHPYTIPVEWMGTIRQPQGTSIPVGRRLRAYHDYFKENDARYSCYILPVGTGENMSGLLGLVKCNASNFWSTELIQMLQAAAHMIHTFLERRESRQALAIAHEEAVASNRFKNEILAKVSHELKTPLGAILGYSELLQEGIYGQITPTQSGILEEVIDSTDYLNTLVSELLEQAKLDSSSLVLHCDWFMIRPFLTTIENQISVLAQNKNLKLRFNLAADLPEHVYNDQSRLQQVIINLVGNAIKFTPKGNVDVTVGSTENKKWSIDVTDSGIGIPPAALEKIFDPFWQVDGSVSRESGGTGLGLSITKQIVSLMGGTIELTSTINQGSTFSITIPIVVGETSNE